MITVTTPNGRIGSVVVRQLLEMGEQVRVVSHSPDRLPASVRERCEIIAGSLDDAETLKCGFEGADAIFWCIPQSSEGNRWDDAHEYHHRFALAAATALRGSSARVVAASAGRHGYEDHGIISAFAAVEDTLNASGANVRHLRSAFFMENLLEALPTLATTGAVFFNGPSDLQLPMVAIDDVAHKAVELIVERSWEGQGHIAVHGPAHVSFDEMATVFTDVLATPIRYVQVPDQVMIDNMTRVGLPEGFAVAFTRLLSEDALRAYDIEPRTSETTTPTTLRDWAGATLLPAFEGFEARQGS
ncbi:NmrA family NAD(P)-binding protein [Actinomycetes bacterium M1A6_2h]